MTTVRLYPNKFVHEKNQPISAHPNEALVLTLTKLEDNEVTTQIHVEGLY